MAENKNNKKHDLKGTYGTFKFVGKIFGVDSERFFKEMTFEDSGSKKRECNFGIETAPGNKVYVKVEGFAPKPSKNIAKFSKWDSDAKKRIIKEIDWEDRHDFEEEGYYPNFGVRVGLELDEKGNLDNYRSYFGYDACEEIQMSLTDGMDVVVEGNVKYSSHKKNGEKRQYVNFNVNKIFVLKKPLDFESETFKQENKFTQKIVYQGIEKHPEKDKTFVLRAVIVNSDGVEDVEYVVKNVKIANPVKKALKPYDAIDVLCRVISESSKDDVEDDDSWGEDEDMDTGYKKLVNELVITKVYKQSLDRKAYTEEAIEAIRTPDDDFGDDFDGDGFGGDDDEDDVVW